MPWCFCYERTLPDGAGNNLITMVQHVIRFFFFSKFSSSLVYSNMLNKLSQRACVS